MLYPAQHLHEQQNKEKRFPPKKGNRNTESDGSANCRCFPHAERTEGCNLTAVMGEPLCGRGRRTKTSSKRYAFSDTRSMSSSAARFQLSFWLPFLPHANPLSASTRHCRQQHTSGKGCSSFGSGTLTHIPVLVQHERGRRRRLCMHLSRPTS